MPNHFIFTHFRQVQGAFPSQMFRNELCCLPFRFLFTWKIIFFQSLAMKFKN